MNNTPQAAPLVLAALLLSGCASPASNPRQDPPAPEQALPAPSPLTSLDEFVDLAVQDLTVSLPQHPMVKESSHRQVLGVGPVTVTGFHDSAPFEQAIASLRANIMRSAPLQDAFRMVETDEPTGHELLNSVGGSSAQFASPDGSNQRDLRPASYHPADIFVLSGTFAGIRAAGGRESAFRYEIQVAHPQSRSVIYRKEFRQELVWNSELRQWSIRR